MAHSTRLTLLADMDTPVTVVTPSHGWVALQLGKVWEYRELLYFLGSSQGAQLEVYTLPSLLDAIQQR